jgi:hypothetical protein
MADQCVCGGRQRVRLAFDDQRKIEQVWAAFDARDGTFSWR